MHRCTWRAGLNGYVQPHIHIAAGGIGVRAHLVRLFHQRFGRSNEVMLFVKGKKNRLRPDACQLSVSGAALQPFAGTPAPTPLALNSRDALSPVGAGVPAKGRKAAPNYLTDWH